MDDITNNETIRDTPISDIEHTKQLQNAKADIYQYLDEGLELEQAFAVAGTPTTIITELTADANFMACTKQRKALLERTLIQKLHSVIDINVPRGKSDEIRFLLQAINPEKYGGKQKEDSTPPVVVNIGTDYEGI